MADNFILFANIFNNISINTIEISQNLESGIVCHNATNSENKINLSTFYTYKTSNDTLYEKKYNELTPDEKTSIHNDYIKNKGKNIQYIDSDGVKIKFTENSIKLVQNSNNFTVNYLKRNAKSIELVLNESLTICSDAKIDKLIIECDLIPFQLFNNFSKRIIKTINIGTMLQNSEPLKNSYFKVIKERINSINITISFIKNITYIYDFKQDDINITLHFRKIK